MRTTVDLIDFSLAALLDRDILERVWSGKDVYYKQFGVFGCWVFVHVSKDERSKLDNRSKQGIF